MRNWKMWAMMVIAVFAFSACCSTDGEVDESTKLSEVFTGKRVTEISYKYSEKGENREEITYANNKLTKYVLVEVSELDERHEEVHNVTYSGNKVKTYYKSTTSKDSKETLYTLNAEGYAISATVTNIEDEGEEKVSTRVTNQTFEYANGYLTKIVSTDSEGLVTTVKATYSDGDMASYSITGFRVEDLHTYVYTVSDIVNKGGILPLENAWFACDGNLEMGYYAGILGKPTKHLVAKTQGDIGLPFKYEYTFENEYVKTIALGLGAVSYSFQ